jgi:hypothetical protein
MRKSAKGFAKIRRYSEGILQRDRRRRYRSVAGGSLEKHRRSHDDFSITTPGRAAEKFHRRSAVLFRPWYTVHISTGKTDAHGMGLLRYGARTKYICAGIPRAIGSGKREDWFKGSGDVFATMAPPMGPGIYYTTRQFLVLEPGYRCSKRLVDPNPR